MARIEIVNQTAPATPSAGETVLFVDSADKLLKSKDDTGAVVNYGSAGVAITALTGEVTATGPGSSAATVSNSAVLAKVLTGLSAATGNVLATDSILQAFGKLMIKANQGFYPMASDGNVTYAADFTILRDMYYDNLTIDSGATLYTNGFRIFANSVVNNGTIDRSGNNATGTAATAALVAGTLGAAGAGGAGGAAAGSAGGASAISLGGAAGAGGLGSGGAGGAAGAKTDNTAANGGLEIFNNQHDARSGRNLAAGLITGGAGGGGGGGDGVAGGAGGGGAGTIVLISKSVTGTGLIKAVGGAGFSAITGGNKGGGGGGGGGVVAIISENDVTATSLTISVAGGIGASGTGTGASGANGSNGRIYLVRA